MQGLARTGSRYQVFRLLTQLLSLLSRCATDSEIQGLGRNGGHSELLVELLRAWFICLGPRWTNQSHRERKLFFHCRRDSGPYQLLWKFLPLEERCRAAFLTVGELRTYVLSKYGTLLVKLVFFYLSNSLAPCLSVSCPFYKCLYVRVF